MFKYVNIIYTYNPGILWNVSLGLVNSYRNIYLTLSERTNSSGFSKYMILHLYHHYHFYPPPISQETNEICLNMCDMITLMTEKQRLSHRSYKQFTHELEVFTHEFTHELLRDYSNNPSRNDKILSKLVGSRNKSHMVITNYLKQHFSSMLLSSFSQ